MKQASAVLGGLGADADELGTGGKGELDFTVAAGKDPKFGEGAGLAGSWT